MQKDEFHTYLKIQLDQGATYNNGKSYNCLEDEFCSVLGNGVSEQPKENTI